MCCHPNFFEVLGFKIKGFRVLGLKGLKGLKGLGFFRV